MSYSTGVELHHVGVDSDADWTISSNVGSNLALISVNLLPASNRGNNLAVIQFAGTLPSGVGVAFLGNKSSQPHDLGVCLVR